MEDHFKIRIKGRVQGVFFRSSTQKQALMLGVRGFVRNEPDGSVYVEAEGDEPALASLLDWCRRGPPRAQVEHVEVTEGQLKFFSDFSIR